jgi:hypothetical protein
MEITKPGGFLTLSIDRIPSGSIAEDIPNKEVCTIMIKIPPTI